MDQSQLKQIQQNLWQEKKDLEMRLESNDNFDLDSSMKEMGSIGELSLYDNHPADIGTEVYERGKDVALNEHAEQNLEEIEEALQRIEKGTYGTCVKCGQDISVDRLKAVPTAKYCVEHQPNDEISERRPVEEEVLESFGKYNFDGRDDETEFDSEDAWQAVGRYNDSDMEEQTEPIGYVEPVEGFASTGIEGYTGYDNIQFVRNYAYKQYEEREEGEGVIYEENDENDMF